MLTNIVRPGCVCLTRDRVIPSPIPLSHSCSLFHLPTLNLPLQVPSLGVPGSPSTLRELSRRGGASHLLAHPLPPLPSPFPPWPEGLALDEVTSCRPKPHPTSTPILGIRKYDQGTSSSDSQEWPKPMLGNSLERPQRRSEEKGMPGQGVRRSIMEEWEGSRRKEKQEEREGGRA